MKIGKIPVAYLVLLIIALTDFVLQRLYPGRYKFDSQFIEGAFFGAALVYVFYYISTRVKMSAKNSNKAEHNSAI